VDILVKIWIFEGHPKALIRTYSVRMGGELFYVKQNGVMFRRAVFHPTMMPAWLGQRRGGGRVFFPQFGSGAIPNVAGVEFGYILRGVTKKALVGLALVRGRGSAKNSLHPSVSR